MRHEPGVISVRAFYGCGPRASRRRMLGTIDEVTRFNEAIDRAIAESVGRFTESVDYARNLLLAVMGYDLRTPLNAVALSARLVQALLVVLLSCMV